MKRKTVRLVTEEDSKSNNVTRMNHELGWTNLEDRRKDIRLTMYYPK